MTNRERTIDTSDRLWNIQRQYIIERARLLDLISESLQENSDVSQKKIKTFIEELSIIDNNLSTVLKFFNKENK